MSQHGTAKAGHGGTAGSGGDGGTARDDPAAEALRVGIAGIGPEGEAGQLPYSGTVRARPRRSFTPIWI